MTRELFNIKPQEYFNSKGKVIDTFEIVLIRFSYSGFATSIQAYVEKRNARNEQLEMGFNVSIDTPENWGVDDMDVIKVFAAHPKVGCEVLDFYTEPQNKEL
jgi:hypothetical protein